MCESETEFYTLLSRTPDIHPRAFENNWPYILQAARNGLYMHRKDNSIVYYTKRFPQRPHTTTVIIYALGPHRRALMLEVARREHENGRHVIMKNVSVDDVPWWAAHGFRVRTRPWDAYSLHDDNSFPQYVSHADTIRQSDYSKKYRKVLRRTESRHAIITDLYDNRYDDDVRTLLEKHSHNLDNKHVGERKEVGRALDFFFDSSIRNCLRFQFTEHEKLIGCSFFTIVNNVAYSNALITQIESDLPKIVTHRSMYWITEHIPQVAYFCRQGSETAGQDWMKSRLNPFEAIHRVHMEYTGPSS